VVEGIPAMAAREVVIAALGVIYAMSGDEDTVTQTLLSQEIRKPK
jgi:ferrous iron transport protein B